MLANEPDLVAARPIIAATVAGVVGSDAFASLFRRAARDVHRALFTRDQDTLTLTLIDVGTVVAAALRELRPGLADELARADRLEVARSDIGAATGDLARAAAAFRVLTVLVAGLALAAVAAAVATAPDRRRTVSQLGLGVVAAGLVIVVGGVIARFAVLEGVDDPAATHNSMSAPLPGWFAALQERPIDAQLEDGVRGLLLDTHYADRLANGRTRTYFGGPDAFRRAIQQDAVSRQSIEAAQRLRDRLGFRGNGERGIYLCHTFCELGSAPLATALDEIHEFLVTHPHEILVIINQDNVTPADFVAAVDEAGLAPYAFRGLSTAPLPTLREMIERDERLVLLAENRAGAAPWYRLAYERVMQETPYSFDAPIELTAQATLRATCRPNRGSGAAPLFLVNHWINTDPAPRPSNAAAVNAFDPLLRRACACQRLRGRMPNLLAVDFYTRGDLFRVVDALNGVSARAEEAATPPP